MTDAELDAILAVHIDGRVGTHWESCHLDGNPRYHSGCAIGKLVAQVRRLRAALTWAVGYLRCNHAAAAGEYPDYRNACELVEGRNGLLTGEFQMAMARAEVAEYERDKLTGEFQMAMERAEVAEHERDKMAEQLARIREAAAPWGRQEEST